MKLLNDNKESLGKYFASSVRGKYSGIKISWNI
jgi:hypothetical protein